MDTNMDIDPLLDAIHTPDVAAAESLQLPIMNVDSVGAQEQYTLNHRDIDEILDIIHKPNVAAAEPMQFTISKVNSISGQAQYKFKIRLVNEVRKRSIIFNPKHKKFFDSKAKEETWQRIANRMQTDVDVCYNTWIDLRYNYQNYARRLRNFMHSGNKDRKRRPMMMLETQMLFLWPYILDEHRCALPYDKEDKTTNEHVVATVPVPPTEDDDIVLVEDDPIVINLDDEDDNNPKTESGILKVTDEMRSLVAIIKDYPELYDRKNLYHGDYKRRGIIWNAIANELSDKATKLMKMWIYMQTRYECEINSIVSTNASSELIKLMSFLRSHIINNPNTVYKQSHFLKMEWIEPIDNFRSTTSLLSVIKKNARIINLTEEHLSKCDRDETYFTLWNGIARLRGSTAAQCEVTWLIMRNFYWELMHMRNHSYQLQDKWYFEAMITDLYTYAAKKLFKRSETTGPTPPPIMPPQVMVQIASSSPHAPPLATATATSPASPVVTAPLSTNLTQYMPAPLPNPLPAPLSAPLPAPLPPLLSTPLPAPICLTLRGKVSNPCPALASLSSIATSAAPSAAARLTATSTATSANASAPTLATPSAAPSAAPSATPSASPSTSNTETNIDEEDIQTNKSSNEPKPTMSNAVKRTQSTSSKMYQISPVLQMQVTPMMPMMPAVLPEYKIEIIPAYNGIKISVTATNRADVNVIILQDKAEQFLREVMYMPLLHNKYSTNYTKIDAYWKRLSQRFQMAVVMCKAIWRHMQEKFDHLQLLLPLEVFMAPPKIEMNVWKSTYQMFHAFDANAVKRGWMKYRKQLARIMTEAKKYPCMYDDLVTYNGLRTFRSDREESSKAAWVMIIEKLKLDLTVDWPEIWTAFKNIFYRYIADLEHCTDNKWPKNWWRVLVKMSFLIEYRHKEIGPLYYILRNKINEEIVANTTREVGHQRPAHEGVRNAVEAPPSRAKVTAVLQEAPSVKSRHSLYCEIDEYSLMSNILKHPKIYEKCDSESKQNAWTSVSQEMNASVLACQLSFQNVVRNYRCLLITDPSCRCRINQSYYKPLVEIFRAVRPPKKLNIRTPTELNQSVGVYASSSSIVMVAGHKDMFPERFIAEITMHNSNNTSLVMKNWAFAIGNLSGFAQTQLEKQLNALFKKYCGHSAS